MAKVQPYNINREEKEKVIKEMFEIIERLTSKKEIIDFLLGLFTASEALMMARRMQVAKLILSGVSYTVIRKRLGVSSHTIQSVERWLYGSNEKNNIWLRRRILGKSQDKNKNNNKRIKNSNNLLDRYAHHRFIKDIFGLQ